MSDIAIEIGRRDQSRIINQSLGVTNAENLMTTFPIPLKVEGRRQLVDVRRKKKGESPVR